MKTKIVSSFYHSRGEYIALVPRGTSINKAMGAVHEHAMAKYKADGVPVWFSGQHVGPLTIYKFEVWY